MGPYIKIKYLRMDAEKAKTKARNCEAPNDLLFLFYCFYTLYLSFRSSSKTFYSQTYSEFFSQGEKMKFYTHINL
jgi:hypothetical protein